MKIAVLMTVHNRRAKTLQCLECLFNNQIPNGYSFDVFMTNDGCTDGTPQAVREKYNSVIVVEGTGNLYWNRGMLLAWETAYQKGGYNSFLWLNDDTFLKQSAIKELFAYSLRHPQSIIVGSSASSNGEITYGGYRKGKILIKPVEREELCDYFNGNVVLVPIEVSDRIGLLDKKFSHTMGDYEYGMRAQRNNIRCYATPAVGICERNSNYLHWMDTNYPVWNRIKYLYSPLGQNPIEAFHLVKSESLLRAVAVFMYLNLKACFPRVFKNRNHQ